jgi:hypothetical protein
MTGERVFCSCLKQGAMSLIEHPGMRVAVRLHEEIESLNSTRVVVHPVAEVQVPEAAGF